MLQSINKLLLFKKSFGPQCMIVNLLNVTLSCRSKTTVNYEKCYRILEIPNDSDQESVRQAFINLCKKYHPDCGLSSADAVKFQEIETAYRLLQNKFADDRWNSEEGLGEFGLYYKDKKSNDPQIQPEVFDIKHTAPQHRQYLSFDGVGSGTPSQREKQYIKYKRVVAVENVYNHHVKKLSNNNENSLIVKDKKEAKKIKTKYGMERLVEDLIQESMAKGHFDNLKGQGKPLPQSNYNPYVDFVTHKMNQILIDNGFTPEWITLQKEISEEIDIIKDELLNQRKKMGPFPLNYIEEKIWETVKKNLAVNVKKLNEKINKFNLVVPILEKQKLFFNLEKESCDILKTGFCNSEHLEKDNSEVKETITSDNNFSVFSFFK